MKTVLIGDTGLIGQNLLHQTKFDAMFNSKNINQFVNLDSEVLDIYLSCLPATKWQINNNIIDDINNINSIINVLKTKRYNNVVLFSTIDVYTDSPLGVDENYNPIFKTLHYGSNRLLFEKMIQSVIDYNRLYVIRLPALFGNFLKKNIIFDLLNNNCVEKININTSYQWYDLNDLYYDVQNIVSSYSGGIFNLFPEPISTSSILKTFFPDETRCMSGKLVEYNWKTFHTSSGYTMKREHVTEKIAKFIYEMRNK